MGNSMEITMTEQMCEIIVCTKSALENGYCEDHQNFVPANRDIVQGGKHLKLLLERISRSDIIEYSKGINGLIAVTKSIVYIVRGTSLQRKVIKTYELKSISSIELKKPNILTNGHFQIITSGNSDQTNRYSSAFDYAKDENTIMFRSSDYDQFVKIEKLIYSLRDQETQSHNTLVESVKKDDTFAKIEKLAQLRDKQIITKEEFEKKKIELLAEL
jgi:hypothetical protein